MYGSQVLSYQSTLHIIGTELTKPKQIYTHCTHTAHRSSPHSTPIQPVNTVDTPI